MPGKFYAGQDNYITLLNDMADDRVVVSHNPASNAQTLDLSQGHTFFEVLGASATTAFTFTNLPTSLPRCIVYVYVKQNSAGSKTITFAYSGGTFKWAGGSQPAQTATANTTDLYRFDTFDGGTTWWAGRMLANYQA